MTSLFWMLSYVNYFLFITMFQTVQNIISITEANCQRALRKRDCVLRVSSDAGNIGPNYQVTMSLLKFY